MPSMVLFHHQKDLITLIVESNLTGLKFSISCINFFITCFSWFILFHTQIIFDPKLMSKTFLQIWKKLGDGVTPNETANSLLLMEMGYIRLRNVASTLVQMIELTEEIVKCYIEMFIRYVNSRKNVSS